MTTVTKKEYIRLLQKRYFHANRDEKTLILNEICNNLSCHRKSAIRLICLPLAKKECKKAHKKRPFTYSKKTLWIIEELWKHSDYLCSQRLKAAIPIWLPFLKKRYPIDSTIEKQLLLISPATIDRRLAKKKKSIKLRIYSQTKPAGRLLRYQVPIRTHNFDIFTPGFIEMDLVAHCGTTASGEYAYTLTFLDIATGWVERRCILGKSRHVVVEAIDSIRMHCPIHTIAFDTDTGSEFINDHLIAYCKEHNIIFTRSRPYHKNDQAHVEQKNYTHVRRILGYQRFDTKEAVAQINDLYKNELYLFQNFFQPSYKLIKKTISLQRPKRTYHSPKTPLDRLLSHEHFDATEKTKLTKLFSSLDPFSLEFIIRKKLSLARTLQNKHRSVA